MKQSRQLLLLIFLLLGSLPPLWAEESTWFEKGGEVYGARADNTGPIGGDKGYTKIMTSGDYEVKTLDELLEALKKVKSGEVIYLPGEIEIDCTVRVYIEKLVLEIPAGVTLAGNRGYKGSKGALIKSETFQTLPLIKIAGSGVRITGLRIQGPNPHRHMAHHRRSFREGRGRKYYYKFPVSRGIETRYDRLEVDNCELSGWSHAAIYLRKGRDHHIHHNYIHHNQYNGLGYGVCHNTSFSLIEYNKFNYNRHSIAGTGRPKSGYEARHNIEMGVSLSHCFDMHGGRDRGDGTNIAGTSIKIHHNTFWAPKREVAIRGVPQEGAEIHHNWFFHRRKSQAIRSGGKTKVYKNGWGRTNPKVR